jgi:hypothetical protein
MFYEFYFYFIRQPAAHGEPVRTGHRRIYLFALALLVISLPLSRFLLSLSQFILVLNWLAEGRFKEKAALAARRPSILFFAAVFFIYALGLLYTEHLETGLLRVRNALPLLLLPLIMGTSAPLSDKHIRPLLLLFSAAVMMAAVVCLVHYFVQGIPADGDFRTISIFMLHIRFSLMIVLAVFILLYLAVYSEPGTSMLTRLFLIVSAGLLAGFLFFLRSFTGVIIFMAVAAVFLTHIGFLIKRPWARNGFLMLVLALILLPVLVTFHTWNRNFCAKPLKPSDLENLTLSSNPYTHDLKTGALENGYYIDIYICEPELHKEWSKVSTIDYDSTDRRGQPISLTLRRYLTSMGLRKDSAALSRLKKSDIEHVESGLANYRFREQPGIYQRLYETLWEVHILNRSDYVQQHSLGQRLAFLSAAGTIIRRNLMTGVGTGDVYDAMLQETAREMRTVDPRWEGKPHNQFLFYILAFGLPGFLLIGFCFLYPVIKRRTYRIFLFNIFAGILLISMLVLDTLESYDSMVFFSFFYCLFVFASAAGGNSKA